MIYGNLPQDCGKIDISPKEMMFWMYLPIKVPGGKITLPDNVKQFEPIVEAAIIHEHNTHMPFWHDLYIYLTAKTLWVTKGNIGNRPGWHSDGFGGDDVNYIWADRAPTDFIEDSFTLPDNCSDAMEIMTAHAEKRPLVHYPDKHLLRLDPSVIHRSPVDYEDGMRSFVKVSFSTERYNLEGNSINHLIGDLGPMVPREAVRNHPVRTDYVKLETA